MKNIICIILSVILIISSVILVGMSFSNIKKAKNPEESKVIVADYSIEGDVNYDSLSSSLSLI